MNQKKLAETLGVSSTAVGNWLREGMPCKVAGTRGRSAVFDLAEVLEWLKANGKGFGIRRDREGISTHVPELLAAQVGLSASPMFTAEDLRGAARRHVKLALGAVLRVAWDNFPIAAAASIRFARLEPAAAVDLAFHQAGILDFVLRYLLEMQGLALDDGTEPVPDRVRMYLDGERQELSAIAADLVSLWDEDPESAPPVPAPGSGGGTLSG